MPPDGEFVSPWLENGRQRTLFKTALDVRKIQLLALIAAPVVSQEHGALRALLTENNAGNAVHHHDTTSATPNYVSYAAFRPGTVGCKPEDLITKGSTLSGVCITFNSTASTDYQCSSPAGCQVSLYGSGDCSGRAEQVATIKTDGSCQRVEDPRSSAFVSMIATQTKDGIQGLARPVAAIYHDDACATAAWSYVEQGMCHTFKKMASKQVCVGGEPQTCFWRDVSKCPSGTAGGTCNPSHLATCKSVPGQDWTRSIKQIC